METVAEFSFLDLTVYYECSQEIKDTYSLEEKLWKTRQHIKKQRHQFADKGLSSQSYGFSNSLI